MKTATEANLNRWLREFDDRHFGGKLSTWKVVIGDHPDMVEGSEGCCVRKEKSIYIPKGILDCSENKIKGTLLHELAHIRGGSYHGKHFKNEIRRFQKEGAPINKIDLADVKYPTGKYVRMFIDNKTIEGHPLEIAQAEVAKKYNLSTDEFLRRYPKASKGTPGGAQTINTPPSWWQSADNEGDEQPPLQKITFKKFRP